MRCAILAAALLLSQQAVAWQYDDERNVLSISGTVCRGENGAAERLLRHNPGSTSVLRSAESVRVYCPLTRRNLHAYDASLSDEYAVSFYLLSVKVDSPSGNLRCRLFAKQRFGYTVTFSDWRQPLTHWFGSPVPPEYVVFLMESDEPWRTVNWGVMCDVPGGEAIKSIVMVADNNNA